MHVDGGSRFLVFLGIRAHPPTKGAEVLVNNKVQQEARIGLVRIEGLVKVRRQARQLRQAAPGDHRKIMMFVMKAYIQHDPIEWTIIRIGLLEAAQEMIVLLQPAGA